MTPRFLRPLLWTALVSVAGLTSTAALAQSGNTNEADTATYTVEFAPLNSDVTGQEAAGEAQLEVDGDNLIVTLMMRGVPASTVHWQHFHGFKDGSAATCATMDDDANGDGIVDLMETEKASGTTMVPFDNSPSALDVAGGTYPGASADGAYSYRQIIPLKKLQDAFGKAFDGQDLQLDKRVIYIHGVPGSTKLADSVASLGPIPASVTLPIACGEIKRVE